MNIKIIPTGGLCNRMRAIATSLAIAKRYDSPICIYWNNHKGLRADFHDLFKPITAKRVDLYENKKWLYRINGTKDYLVRSLILKLCYEQVVFNHSIYTGGDIYAKLKDRYKGQLLLVSCYPMCQDYHIQGMFVPQDDIQQRIDEVTSCFPTHIIGVHIRRTDNQASISASPTAVFVRMMKREIAEDKNVMFYVASDDENIKSELAAYFHGKVITLMDNTSRDTLEGMKFAVVDLFCLSKTNKIIGSVASSYSQIAAEIGGIEVEYAKLTN